MITVEEAWEQILSVVLPAPSMPVALHDALGQILAEDLHAPHDVPAFDKSMMDGYAVRSADFQNSSEVELLIIDEVTAGTLSTKSVTLGTAVRIMTGGSLPAGADAVVPVEWTQRGTTDQQVLVSAPKSVKSGMNRISRGDLMHENELVLNAGREIRAQEVALMAELGFAHPHVVPYPRVAVLATGNELVPIAETPADGQIRNSNALMLSAQIREAGGIAWDLGIARDTTEDLREKIQQGLTCDFLCLSGGVSMGVHDLVPRELQAAGVKPFFHKVSMKPGKPVWFGVWSQGKHNCYVFGLPGNPVSSMICFELFVRTALRKRAGISPAIPLTVKAQLSEGFSHKSDRPCWYPGILTSDEGILKVQAVNWKGSADLRSVANANCSLCIAVGETSLPAGEVIDVLPWGGAGKGILPF